MRTTNRLIATATALAVIGAVLAACTSPAVPDVRFSAEKLTISLATMVVGEPVTETLPEAMGGEEDLVYSLSGAVPGLTFDPATRVLRGTPTTPGTYDMTYTATDSATGGTMESVKFTIAVEPVVVTFPAEKLTISLPPMVVGTAIAPVTLPEAMGGREGLVYSLSPDVPGLTFDPATRVLSGTPTTPETYDMTYTATDSTTGGTMESVKFTIVVGVRPLTNEERILGTWQLMNDWREGDGREGIWVDYLTFTTTRFILLRSHILTDGSLDHVWEHHGTWEVTSRELVSIFYANQHDGDAPEGVLVRQRKPYVLDGENDLIVNHWADIGGEDRAWDRMTRVSDPALSLPPLGVWVREWHSDENDWYDIDTMTLASDGTFTWSEQDPSGTWTLTAEWELDLGNYFINLKNATETWTETGGEPEPDERTRGASFLRFAYAPMVSESGKRTIAVSYWGAELDETHGTHGSYWREMTLQQ